MTHTETLRLALEALEWQQEMLYTAMQYSAAKGMTFLGHPPNPNEAITAIKAALEAKDEKGGSPCPEFWDWLPKAYGQSESFTKYNMEVAFLAGAQLSARQQPVAYMGTDIEGNPNKFRLNAFGGSIPLYTTPPQRKKD